MPLSEYEQRVLDQLEQDLGQDPSLHRAMNRPPRAPGRVLIGVLGVIVGLGVVLVGVTAQLPILGIVGFAIMAGAALWALLAPRRSGTSVAAADAAQPSKPSSPRQQSGQSMTERFEERFNRRREGGDL